MPLSYPDILSVRSEGGTASWVAKDAILYALGVGMGADPLDENELPFVYEKALKPVPTMAAVLGWGAQVKPPGVNFLLLVDGERKLVFHKPLQTSGSAVVSSWITGAFDKGEGKGAVITAQTDLTDAADGSLLISIMTSIFARGDGGFGGPSEGQPAPHETPTRAPDRSVDIPTTANQALIYRLSGDYNPLHADPLVAKLAGFPRPILHGMCSYGITCRAVLQTYAGYDPARFKSHEARFAAPVFPGETITVDLWRDDDVVSFEARVKARGVTVIKNGKTVLG